MGWSHTYGASKSDVINEVTRDYTGASGTTFKTLKHCARGNALYAVTETVREGKTERFVAVYLLSKNPNVGWGYKAMDEGMHPYYYGCPVGYLNLCTEPMNDSSAKWREKVRARAATRGRKLAVGDKAELTNGWTVEITGLKPLSCSYKGITYKLSRKMLADVGAKEAA